MDIRADWNGLKIVLAIHRAGSLKAAAAALKVDQSTVGRRLSAIEAELGTILFIRDNHGFEATDAGRKVIKRATGVDFEVMRLQNDLQSTGETVHGMVRITTNPWIATHLLAPNLPLLLDHHPNLKIHTLSDTTVRDLAAREAEISLWLERERNPGELSFLVDKIDYAVYSARNADPAQLKWISYWDDHHSPAPMRQFMREHPGETPLMMANDINAVCSAVRQGIGKAMMPMPVGDAEPGLVRLTDCLPEMTQKLQAVVHPDVAGEPSIRATLGWLQSVCCPPPGAVLACGADGARKLLKKGI